jgi:hypothetical protein
MENTDYKRIRNVATQLETLESVELEKDIFELYNHKIHSLRQCERWLNFYRWFHDQIKQFAEIDEEKQKEHIYLKFTGALIDRDNPKYAGFDILLASNGDYEFRNAYFGLYSQKTDYRIIQYLYARALDYFARQNLADPKNIYNYNDHKYFSGPFKIECEEKLFEYDRHYGFLTERIMDAVKAGKPAPEDIVDLAKEIKQLRVKDKITGFDKVMDGIEAKTRTIQLHK